MPAAHAFIQARDEIERAVNMLSIQDLWVRPGGAASIGFHLRHVAGSIDRLLTYARGEMLSDAQREYLIAEDEPGEPPADAATLLALVREAVDGALETIRATKREDVLERREVGRARLPSDVLGLLFHAADHTQRHAGQIVTTAKIVRGLGLAPEMSGRTVEL
jgi:hypothetical protein